MISSWILEKIAKIQTVNFIFFKNMKNDASYL